MKNVQCKRCVNLRNEWCDKKIDSPDIELIRDCQYYRAKTNADSIRAMTDEALADFINDIWFRFLSGNELPGMCDLCYEGSMQKCMTCWLDWLKQEV